MDNAATLWTKGERNRDSVMKQRLIKGAFGPFGSLHDDEDKDDTIEVRIIWSRLTALCHETFRPTGDS